MDNIHKRNLIDRGRFLTAAYAYASQQQPERPMFQSVHHKFIMEDLGFDEAKCKRLRDELEQDGLIEILGGGQAFRVLDAGRRALEQAEAERIAHHTYNNINATNSNVQLQSHSPNATQTANISAQLDEARAFAERVTSRLDEIEQLITADQFASLKADLDYLKSKLDAPSPKLSLITELRSGLIAGLMALPADLVAFLLGKAVGV
ncbi:MAG: hypothetical protein M3R08_10785 [Bacteroidota bacterium]|nr:hypothetical protein [Bacteroidota bacterium]